MNEVKNIQQVESPTVSKRLFTGRITEWLAIAILLILPFLVYFPVSSGFATFAGYDHTGINQPLKQEAFETLRSGDLPLWEHRLDRGIPLFAEGEAGIFYPLNVLFLIPGDFLTIYNIVLLLLISAGGLLFYWWVRRLGVGTYAAFIGGAAHQWGATINFNKANMNILEGYILAPLLMLLLEPFIQKSDKPWFRAIGIAVVFASMLFAGQAQYVVYTGLFALVYIALRTIFAGRDRLKILLSMAGPFFAGAFLGLGLAAVQLFPTLELIPLSERGPGALAETFATHGLWLSPSRLFATFIFPAYHFSLDHFLPYLSTTCWVGPVPILLAGYAIRFRKKIDNPVLIPLMIAGLIFLWLGMGANAPLAGEITAWGPLGSFRGHGRLTGYFALAILVLMSIGLDTLLKTPTTEPGEYVRKQRTLPLFTVQLVIMALLTIPFITHRAEYLETRIALGLMLSFLAIFFAALLVGHILHSRKPVAVAIFLIVAMQIIGFQATSSETILARSEWNANLADIITIRDDSYNSNEATYIAMRTRASVRLHSRVLAQGVRAFEPGSHQHIDHLGSANVGIMEDLTVCNIDLPLELARWEWLMHRELWPMVDSTTGPLPIRETNLLKILGVNWIVTENGELEVDGFDRLTDESWSNSGVPYYINKREAPVLPRALYWNWTGTDTWTGGYEPDSQYEIDTRAEFVEFLESHDNYEIGSIAFLEGYAAEPEPLTWIGERRTSAIMGDWESPTTWSGTVTTSHDGIFVLRDQWYPGWEVTVNGQPSPLLRANLVFKAVEVNAGSQKVVFQYRPLWLKAGWLVTVMTLLILAGMFWAQCRGTVVLQRMRAQR